MNKIFDFFLLTLIYIAFFFFLKKVLVNTPTDKPLGYVYHVLPKNNRGIDDIVQRRNVFTTHLCYFPAFQILWKENVA